MALNIVPGDEDAEAGTDGVDDGGEDEEEDEFDAPRADGPADLLLEELPHAASRMRAAPANAAMISPRRSRR
jgi:hypothetical protein